MKIVWQTSHGNAGVAYGSLSFDGPALGDYSWPLIEITGAQSGPRMCIMAGVHVNEPSSIEAAIKLQSVLSPAQISGVISILPIVNIPGSYKHVVESPVDGKNLHWIYPGNATGTFSECLAAAILSEWAVGADILLDLHGGDIGENLTNYVVYQQTSDAAWNQECMELASCFDTPVAIGLALDHLDAMGRCCTALARQRRKALVCESGINGTLGDGNVNWHLNGIINIGRHLGIIRDGVQPVSRKQVILDRYHFLTSPADGLIYPEVQPGSPIARGDLFAELRDPFGRKIAHITAPASGYVMWHTLFQFAKKSTWVGAIAT